MYQYSGSSYRCSMLVSPPNNKKLPMNRMERGAATYVVTGHDAVYELQAADHDEEGHEEVDQLRALGRRLLVVAQDIGGHTAPRVRRLGGHCRRRGLLAGCRDGGDGARGGARRDDWCRRRGILGL